MKTLPLDLNQETLERLFQEGVCLTFQPFGQDYWKSILDKEYQYRLKNNLKQTWIVQKYNPLSLEQYNIPFHFFSNGVLIHAFNPAKDNSLRLTKIKRALEFHGYKIKKIFGPQIQFDLFAYNEFLQKISKYAYTQYTPEQNFEIVPLPDKETFLKNCFKNNNILLTASKYEKINPSCRQYLALFENGMFFVSTNYKGGNAINDPSVIYDFSMKYNQYVYLRRLYVPQDYIRALYQKAQKFDWYISPKDASQNLPPQHNLTSEEIVLMQDYILNLLTGRKCISVTLPPSTEPYINHVEARHDWYVLFDDGKLILSKDRHEITNNAQIKTLQLSYPNLTFNIEYVPEYYIPAIYEEVAKTQKTARQIYIEILKQKAKYLKKMLQITHHEALEIAAQMVGFKNFKDALLITEQNARYAIQKEQQNKALALKSGKDYVMKQYQYWKKKLT